MKKFTKTFGLVSISGHVIFIIAVLILHFLRTDLYLMEHFVSEYAVGNHGWVQTIAFFSLAIAQVFLIIGLTVNIKASIISLTTFMLWTICIFLIAIFPTDIPGAIPTMAGNIHNLAALFAFINLAFTMITWGFNFKKNSNFKNLSSVSWLFGAVSLAILIALILSPVSFKGLTQRILISWDLCWLIVISRWLYLIKIIN